MSLLLLLLAPLITADGVNIGNVHRDCTNRAALSVVQSTRGIEHVADYAMAKCRYLEPKLKEALDRSWRTDRSGNVSSPPSDLSRRMTEAAWDDLLKSRRDRLIREIPKARQHLGK